MFPRHLAIGTLIGLLVGAVSAAVLNPGSNDSLIGTSVLGAAVGGYIEVCTAVVTLVSCWLRGRRNRRDT